jgi:cytochrome c nitrite reductase small subunit
MWRYVLASLVGIAAGLGAYTFVYARGYSYFSDNPDACANCHIMREQHDSWQKASHHSFAVCNDCHTPHPLALKYAAKARNGWNHSLHFTLQDFPEPIRIHQFNSEVLEANCLRCHADMAGETAGLHCVACHSGVGHGPRREQ